MVKKVINFKEANKKREKDLNLEHELRAAKVVSWFKNHLLEEDNKKLSDDEAELIFMNLVEHFRELPEEGDEVAKYIYRQIKENKQ
jgi:hypothetical protein